MKKADILLIFGCLLTALLLGLFFMVSRRNGSEIRISCDGVEIERIALRQTDAAGQTQYYLIRYLQGQEVQVVYSDNYPQLPLEQGYNLFSVTGGVVTMEAADCRDQICVNHRPISASGENVICLPHRLVIEISGGEDKASMETQDGYSGGGSSDDVFGEQVGETLDGVVR